MLYLTEQEHTELKALDTMLKTMSYEELHQLVQESVLVEKLKGNPDGHGVFYKLYQDNISMAIKINELESRNFTIQQDIKELIQVLNQTMFNQNNSHVFTNLKYRHNVY